MGHRGWRRKEDLSIDYLLLTIDYLFPIPDGLPIGRDYGAISGSFQEFGGFVLVFLAGFR